MKPKVELVVKVWLLNADAKGIVFFSLTDFFALDKGRPSKGYMLLFAILFVII